MDLDRLGNRMHLHLQQGSQGRCTLKTKRFPAALSRVHSHETLVNPFVILLENTGYIAKTNLDYYH